MKGDEAIKVFYQEIADAWDKETMVKLTLGKRKHKDHELRNIYIRIVVIKDQKYLSFTFHYRKKDEVKNFLLEEGLDVIQSYLGKSFLHGYLFTTIKDYELLYNRRLVPALREFGPRFGDVPDKRHDREKKRYIDPKESKYLYDLGITTAQGNVKHGMNDKYRQINKYIEVIGPLLKKTGLDKEIRIVDMGSGKGYLTFALYDYLVNQRKSEVNMLGIDQNKTLIERCNAISWENGFDRLEFRVGRIADLEKLDIDVLIALHACDTATDEAIYQGIKAGAKLILCAPCCHKEISRQIAKSSPEQPVIQYGILRERQAELLTDTIRALILEANGYDTNVFEFISTEHTPKNIMISAVKQKVTTRQEFKKKYGEITRLKQQYGIQFQYLEQLMGYGK